MTMKGQRCIFNLRVFSVGIVDLFWNMTQQNTEYHICTIRISVLASLQFKSTLFLTQMIFIFFEDK